MRKSRFGFVLLIFLVSLPAAAQRSVVELTSAPSPASPGDLLSYGTGLTVTAVSSAAFVPYTSSVNYDSIGGVRYITTPGASMQANLTIPTGVVIEAIELEACDQSSAGEVLLFLVRCDDPSATLCTVIGSVATGVGAVPGCDRFYTPLPTPFPVANNVTSTYLFSFSNTTVDGSTRLWAARVGYRRQVSPAPLTASFLDVPVGHPLHQFVEALVVSGITAGCGDGNFCPNSPVTRGQMAVFLAKALGLHWPF